MNGERGRNDFKNAYGHIDGPDLSASFPNSEMDGREQNQEPEVLKVGLNHPDPHVPKRLSPDDVDDFNRVLFR